MNPNDSIVTAVLTMTQAFNEGNIERILRSYESDAVVVGEPCKPQQGESALHALFAGLIALKPSFEYSGHEVLVSGDLALHLAPWQMTGIAPDGSRLQQRGLSVAVLRRQGDGGWLLVIDQPHGDALLREASFTVVESGR
jgi:uncharacterized protein (TIGR02246 family)